jgi:hypothetical protein
MVQSTAPALAIGTTPPSWKPRETVAATLSNITDHVGADRILAYDHFGNPGVAFVNNVTDAIHYARRVPGIGWTHVSVGTGFSVDFPSLAFDRYERPFVTFQSGESPGNLFYARFDGSSWASSSLTFGIANALGEHSSLAFDLYGNPVVAHRSPASGGSLRYIVDSDGDFLPDDDEIVTNVANPGLYSSLVIDPLNRPMIAHYASTGGNLQFSIKEPSLGWVTTTVESVNNTGLYPSIDVDPDTGFPAIAYYDGDVGVLRFAAWNGTSWDTDTVDFGLVGQYPSLAFDPSDGNPAIAYFDDFNNDLKLAWHDGTSWQTHTVDAVGDVGYTPSLAFNDYGTGFPSIVYFGETGANDTVFYIEDPPATVPEPSLLVLLGLGLVGLWAVREIRN